MGYPAFNRVRARRLTNWRAAALACPPGLMVLGMTLLGQTPMPDGHCDLYWQNRHSGQVVVWFMQQTQYLNHIAVLQDSGPKSWEVQATGDFNRDGDTDLLWHNRSTDALAIWLMRGTNCFAKADLPKVDQGYAMVGTGDFNHDGWPDILWRREASSTNVVWFMSGTNYTQHIAWLPGMSDTQWLATATGDLNNDGHADVLWRHQTTGQNQVWFLRETERIGTADLPAEPDLQNHLAGTGKFQRVPHTDLIWRHANGTNSLWLMCGPHLLTKTLLPTVPEPEWALVGTGGYTNNLLLSAAVTSSPPSIQLQCSDGLRLSQAIRRRTASASAWDQISATANGLDTNVVPCQEYEYQVGSESLFAGIDLAASPKRGRVLLLVDEILSKNKSVATELQRLATNLVGDGWVVSRRSAPRHNDRDWSANPPRIQQVKQWITEFHQQAPAETNLVFLLGHVVIPYAGTLASDGHHGGPPDRPESVSDHRGAWVADGFYGDLDSRLWTDRQTFVLNRIFPECSNQPGDGKFDNEWFPSDVEVAVGRVDFANLPFFEPSTPGRPSQSEAHLLIRYLNKNNRYRHKQLTFEPRLVVGTFFASEGLNTSLLTLAWRHGSRWFGADPAHFLYGDFIHEPVNALWGFMGGPGGYQAIHGETGQLHVTSKLAQPEHDPTIGFYVIQGSWLADWNLRTNNPPRSLLATANGGLAVFSYSTAVVRFHGERLALGESLGSEWRRTVNQCRPNAERWLSLLGDPTLRLTLTAPPDRLRADSIEPPELSWVACPELHDGYWVLRSTNGLNGPWILLTSTPITETHFRDAEAPAGPKDYQVKTVRRVITGSGSFTNTSQGVFLHLK